MQKLLLIIHIAAGSIALVSGLGAIVSRNKTKIHRPFGKIYFWAMTVVFLSALYLSVKTSNFFLFCVTFFTYYLCLTAYRSLSLKKLHDGQKPKWFDWLIEVFFGLIHLSFVIFACILLIKGKYTPGIISIVFGLIGLGNNYSNIKRLNKKIVYKNYWLLAHIGGMLGSYIGAFTAFLVNNGKWINVPGIVLWLGPTVFFVPLIFYEIRKHQKHKFEVQSKS